MNGELFGSWRVFFAAIFIVAALCGLSGCINLPEVKVVADLGTVTFGRQGDETTDAAIDAFIQMTGVDSINFVDQEIAVPEAIKVPFTYQSLREEAAKLGIPKFLTFLIKPRSLKLERVELTSSAASLTDGTEASGDSYLQEVIVTLDSSLPEVETIELAGTSEEGNPTLVVVPSESRSGGNLLTLFGKKGEDSGTLSIKLQASGSIPFESSVTVGLKATASGRVGIGLF